MDVRHKHLTDIQRHLAYLVSRVKIAGSLNHHDIHIIAEDFYKDLLNKLGTFGTSFKNVNEVHSNAPYIDLIDTDTKVVIQITAQNDSQKISDTIKGSFGNPTYKEYQLKVLLIAKEAKDYRKDFSENGTYNFDVGTDVIDIPRLIGLIKSDGDKLSLISEFLDKQILLPRPPTELNEVETIMELLNYLSDDRNYQEFDGNYVCDPDKKINGRFKGYAADFKEVYMDLFQIYGNTIPEAKKAFGLDGVRAEKISNFLKYISDRQLRESEDNPVAALDKLTDFFSEKLNFNGIRADNGAIRYYLLDELIGCNIFSAAIT